MSNDRPVGWLWRVAIALAVVLVAAMAGQAVGTVVTGYLDNSVQTTGTVAVGAPSGPTVRMQGSAQANLTSFVPAGDTVHLRSSAGNVTAIAAGPANATLPYSQIGGPWTNLSAINASANELYVAPEGNQPVNVSGGLNRLHYRDSMGVDDGTVDFVYAGDAGTTSVTVRGLPADTAIAAVNRSDSDVLDAATTDANGVVTFTGMPNSQHTVLLQTSMGAPVLSNPVPTGNVSTTPSNLQVDVSDSDFPGDNVTVEFYYEGSHVETVDTQTDGTVSTSSIPTVTGGTHEWSAVATDEFGRQDILNASFGVPGTLYIRNVSNPSELVDAPVNVTVRWIGTDRVYQNTTETGTVDMQGLPITDFIVEVDANQSFYSRTVYFLSIVGERNVYLLNTNYTSVETRFQLEDPTGQFDSNTILYLSRPIERNGVTTWRTVYADVFGVEGVTAILEEGQRYRIRIRSPGGTVQDLGPYRADVSEEVTVRPGSPTISLEQSSEGWATGANIDNQTLRASYVDETNQTDSATLWVHERGNKSNVLTPNQTYYELGNASVKIPMTANESDLEWRVNWIVQRDGEEFTTSDVASKNPNVVLSGLSGVWRTIFGIGALFIFAGAFSLLNVKVGAVMTALTGGLLWWTGWLAGATTGAAFVIYLFIAILYSTLRRGPT